jgi:multidrug efflux pump subunit AcrB
VSQFINSEDKDMPIKNIIRLTSIMAIIGLTIFFLGGDYNALGNLIIFTAIMLLVYRLVLRKAANYFQKNTLVSLENWYERQLKRALKGWTPYVLVFSTVLLLVAAVKVFGMSLESQRTKIEFFPDNKPNQIIVYIEYPEGTDIEKTNQITQQIEKKVAGVLNQEMYTDDGYNFMVESTVSQVGEGAGNPQTDGGSSAEMPHKGKITASMREYKYRKGEDSEILRQKVQAALVGIYPGVLISVEKDANGPPAGSPINIELNGEDYEELIFTAERMRDYLNTQSISGVDELKIDVNKSKPGMQVLVDRKKAGELGVSTGQVGQQLRGAIFGNKAGIYKENGEDYDIYVRFNKDDRYNKSAVFNQKITFRDQATGKIKEIPVSAVATQKNSSGFSAIKHKNTKRIVTVYSALSPGETDAGVVVGRIQNSMKNFKDLPKGIKIDYTGQIEEMKKQQDFLNGAFLTGLLLIFFILIFQFNSVSKPGIIMLAIFLSFIGVFGGLVITGASFVIMMTMVGIISLAGIVVNNGVVLLDYTELLIDRRKLQDGISKENYLPLESLYDTVVKAGKARLRPGLLTAITTILGLIALAIGLNINFFTLFSEFDAHVYMGGDNVVFWGPLAKTVIYGLFIATFLTLIVVPILFFLITKFKMRIKGQLKNK